MGQKTKIGSYTILERKQAGEVMIAVGHNPKAPMPFATWKAYDFTNFTSFNHGHFFETRQAAMIDYYQRLAEAWEYYTPSRQKERGHDEPAR